MNINPNALFPNPQFFENVFQEILNNPTLNLIEEENFENRLQPQPLELQPIRPPVQEDNRIIFQIDRTQRRRRRGRIPHINDLPLRRSFRIENLISKIFYDFIRFSIQFCNEALQEENLNIPFSSRMIYFLRPNIIHMNFKNFKLKEKSIKDILKLDISRKYIRSSPDRNRKLLEKIEALSPRLSNLFEMNSLELFKYYYNKEKPLNKITFENKEFYLSPGIKTFYDFLERYKDQREDIIKIVKKYFIVEENNL